MNITELRSLQEQGVTDLWSTLRSVEINPTELCNRTCGFCPRTDPKLYKNSKKFIDPSLCTLIGQQLENFTGRIGFVGFGEPLLHPNLVDCVANIRAACPTAQWIEINTNGDVLTRELAIELAEAGCTNITISLYDKDTTEYFTEMLAGVNVQLILRHYYNPTTINLVNRINIISKGGAHVDLKKPCYMPFYKLFIDWDGSYLLCEQDWEKVTSRFTYNVREKTIKEFWLEDLNRYRVNLMVGNRGMNPCSKCDIDGTKHGEASFRMFHDTLATK